VPTTELMVRFSVSHFSYVTWIRSSKGLISHLTIMIMNLEEAINLLQDTFTTIDIRTASFLKDNSWNSAIFVLRFRKESVDEVHEQQKEILDTHGKIDTKDFQVCFSALPISQWDELRANWKQNFVKFNDKLSVNIDSSVALTHTFAEPYSHSGYCAIDEEWNSFYTSSQGNSSINIETIFSNHQTEARKFFSRDIHEYLSKIFEMTTANTNSPPRYIIIVPVFFKVDQIAFGSNSVDLICKGFPMGELMFNLNFSDRHGSYAIPKKSVKFPYNFTGDATKKLEFNVSKKLPSFSANYEFKLDVFRKNGLLIATESGSIENHPHDLSSKVIAESVTEAKHSTETENPVVFISHAMDDYKFVKRISTVLELFGLDVFLAHQDIEPTKKFEEEIIENLKKAPIFIPILTKAFNESVWTDQETGIAISSGSKIFPIIVDINPYGFIEKFQGLRWSDDFYDNVSKLVSKIIDILPSDQKASIRKEIIENFGKSEKCHSYDISRVFSSVVSTFTSLTNDEIEFVAKGTISNEQVHDSATARPSLCKIFRSNKNKISQKYLNNEIIASFLE